MFAVPSSQRKLHTDLCRSGIGDHVGTDRPLAVSEQHSSRDGAYLAEAGRLGRRGRGPRIETRHSRTRSLLVEPEWACRAAGRSRDTRWRGWPVQGINLEMTIKTWLEAAIQDADRRNLAGLRPLLEALARSTSALRSADWNFDPTGEPIRTSTPPDAR